MRQVRNPWLVAGGLASAAGALAHLACILGGASWYRAIGAPPQVVHAVAIGSWRPPLFGMGIVFGLSIWAAYALAAGGVLRRLPAMRPALIAIATVYCARGLLVRPEMLGRSDLSPSFAFWSAMIVLAMGVVHAVGLCRGWKQL